MLKLGRLAPHDPATHPRLQLADALGTYPPAPAVVDYIGNVAQWPMYLNDELGDCTCAAAGHMIEAWTAYGTGATIQVGDSAILTAYEAVGGYKPGHPDTDQGANMQDVLNYWRKTGIGGHKILAFAEVNVRNVLELEAAMALFGHVYLGINFPNVAMDQFNNHEPWDAVADDGGIEGGHAIDWGYAALDQNYKVITWGAVQEMTPAFFTKYVEEAWIVVDQEWINKNGDNPEGLDLAALGAAFTDMTGEANPFPAPAPTPAPVPAPQPVPVSGADAALAAVLRADGWVSARHSGDNAHVASAARVWLAAKGL